MAAGTAFGGVCYGTQAEASAMLCSALQGISSAGAVSCVGVSGGSSSVGGDASLTLTLRTASGDSTIASALLACETYGPDYWEPYVAAWFVAAMAIVAAKMTYTRIFGSPTHA